MSESEEPIVAESTTKKPEVVHLSTKNIGGKVPKKKKANRSKWLLGMWFAGALVLAISAGIWYSRVYQSPTNVFWGMIDNNLSTQSVTRTTNPLSKTDKTSTKITQLIFNDTARVRTLQTVSDSSTNPPTKLTLEGIGTPVDDYQHYKSVDRPATNGVKKDYSSLYPLWLHIDLNDPNNTPQLFLNAIFNPILFGNLNEPQRNDVVAKLKQKNAYRLDLAKVSSTRIDGHKAYVYEVNLNLRDYATAAKAYAQTLGLKNASQINPNNYPASQKIPLRITVDVGTRQLVSVDDASAKTEDLYSAYGAKLSAPIPTNIVTSKTLQDTLDKINKK